MAREVPPDGQRCTAKAKSTGERCKNPRKPGQEICGVHGGEAPQNKKAALDLLREAVDPLTQEKIDMARDALEKYKEAKKAGAEEKMAFWMKKFNGFYEEIADRAGPPKVKRKEMTGEEGGPVQTSGVLKVPEMAEDHEEWEERFND